MSARYRAVFVLAIFLAIPAGAIACLWDRDTLRQERARFPDALELITGKFLRHSKEFYQWRIEDRLRKLSADPENLAYHDDLAVAYELTGQHDKAIETILAKEKIKPGLYETYSNLGTFHILAGDLEQGLPYIDKALAIKPDAHFGRERYQKWLVEYAIAQRRDGKLVFPLRSIREERAAGRASGGFRGFLERRQGDQGMTEPELLSAVKGVLGMMRFADHTNPLLLEALGDLLWLDRPSFDSSRLAARCYLKASYVVDDPASQQQYRELAEAALKLYEDHNLTELEAEFSAELAHAETWYAELRENEIDWIQEAKDVEAEFDRLYDEDPIVPDDLADGETDTDDVQLYIIIFGVSAVAITSIVLFWRRRRSAAAVG